MPRLGGDDVRNQRLHEAYSRANRGLYGRLVIVVVFVGGFLILKNLLFHVRKQ